MTQKPKSKMTDVALVHNKLWIALAAFPLLVGLNASCMVDEEVVEVDSQGDISDADDDSNLSDVDRSVDVPDVSDTGNTVAVCTEQHDALGGGCGANDQYWSVPKEKAWEDAEKQPDYPDDVLGCPEYVRRIDISGIGGDYFFLVIPLTQSERDKGNDCVCHYFSEDTCMDGRPLTDGEHHIVACVQDGAVWGGDDLASHTELHAAVQTLSDAAREQFGQEWLRDALFEHASVASFGRASLELMRHGAPPYLLNATLRAGLDEVEHAKLCFALASAYAGKPLQAGTILDMPGVRAQSLAQLAVDVFLEGAVEESTAVLAAVRAAAKCEVGAAKEALTKIADDETNHAALAWATLAWTLTEGGEPVREALLLAFREGESHIQRIREREMQAPVANREAWALHGRLTPDEQQKVRVDAWDGVVKPTLTKMLGAVSVGNVTRV